MKNLLTFALLFSAASLGNFAFADAMINCQADAQDDSHSGAVFSVTVTTNDDGIPSSMALTESAGGQKLMGPSDTKEVIYLPFRAPFTDGKISLLKRLGIDLDGVEADSLGSVETFKGSIPVAQLGTSVMVELLQIITKDGSLPKKTLTLVYEDTGNTKTYQCE